MSDVSLQYRNELYNNLMLLKKHREYDNSASIDDMPSFRYLMDVTEYDFTEPLSLSAALSEKNEIEKIIAIMQWLSRNIVFDGRSDSDCTLGTLQLNIPVNCFKVAQLLNDLYSFYGFYARMVQTKPYSEANDSNHWVNLVFSNTLKKWIMMDAAFCAYCRDKEGNLLSVQEIRKLISCHKPVHIIIQNDNMSANQYFYLVSETYFQFNCFLIQGKDVSHIDGQQLINLSPIGYNSKKFYDTRIKEEVMQGLSMKTIKDLELCHQMRIFTNNDCWFWSIP